ncbi:hypothetical protein COP1_045558 [Malus domestica]
MDAEALPATANPVVREALLVLGLQASGLVDHVVCVDCSLFDQLPGERSGSIPPEELILTVAAFFFLFALSHAHTSSDLLANEISDRDPAGARLPESRPKPRQPTFIVPDYLIELGDLGFGRGIHGDALKSGCSSNGFVGSSLMGLYSRCGFVKDAAEVLDETEKKTNRYETEKKPIFPKILWIQRSQFLGKFQEMEIRTKYLHQMESAIFSPRQSLFHVHGSTAGDI